MKTPFDPSESLRGLAPDFEKFAKEHGHSPTATAGPNLSDSPTSLIHSPESNEPEISGVLGGFRIIRTLGKGGMGLVYLAYDPQLDRHVALKVVLESLTRDPVLVERMRREARSAAQLQHPGIVAIHSMGEDGGRLFYAMEYVNGSDLASIVEQRGPLSALQALEVVRQAAEALAYGWKFQIVHRDIKPSNLILTPEGRLKLADFGLAKQIGTDMSLTMTGFAVGSPFYMSPEQALGDDVDFRSDIYALGCTLHCLLTGRVPFEGTTPMKVLMRHSNDPVPNPPEIAKLLGGRVSALVARMMAKKAEDRHPTYSELIAEIAGLEDLLVSDPSLGGIAGSLAGSSGVPRSTIAVSGLRKDGGRPPGGPGYTKPAASRRTWVFLAVGVAVVALGGVGWIGLKQFLYKPLHTPGAVVGPKMTTGGPASGSAPPPQAGTRPSPMPTAAPPPPIADEPVDDAFLPPPPGDEGGGRPLQSLMRIGGAIELVRAFQSWDFGRAQALAESALARPDLGDEERRLVKAMLLAARELEAHRESLAQAAQTRLPAHLNRMGNPFTVLSLGPEGLEIQTPGEAQATRVAWQNVPPDVFVSVSNHLVPPTDRTTQLRATLMATLANDPQSDVMADQYRKMYYDNTEGSQTELMAVGTLRAIAMRAAAPQPGGMQRPRPILPRRR